MRDIVLTLAFFLTVPRALKHPWFGIMLWVFISIMAPHRMTWGFAYHLPFAQITAIATLIGLFFTNDRVKFPVCTTTILLILLPVWMTISYLFALEPESAHPRWVEVMKIYFFVLVATTVLNTQQHVRWLLWVLAVSVGFYGIKGGFFTILTAGAHRVWGPPDSFISDNNTIAVALVAVIPIMYYLAVTAEKNIVRYGLWGAILLSTAAVLGTHSRGALLAISAMALFLLLKSRQKFLIGVLLLVTVPIVMVAMPEHWFERMSTIQHYEEDESAMGRINTWKMVINLANDRPLVGGGFEHYSKATFATYAPHMDSVHAAHSIYFQMLGEHGYVGLLLFLLLGANAWWTAKDLIRRGRRKKEYEWVVPLGQSLQVSLVGYAVGGAFVNIAYWEFLFYEIVALMVTRNLLVETEGMDTESPRLDGPRRRPGADHVWR